MPTMAAVGAKGAAVKNPLLILNRVAVLVSVMDWPIEPVIANLPLISVLVSPPEAITDCSRANEPPVAICAKACPAKMIEVASKAIKNFIFVSPA